MNTGPGYKTDSVKHTEDLLCPYWTNSYNCNSQLERDSKHLVGQRRAVERRRGRLCGGFHRGSQLVVVPGVTAKQASRWRESAGDVECQGRASCVCVRVCVRGGRPHSRTRAGMISWSHLTTFSSSLR